MLIISGCQTEKIILIDYTLPAEPTRQEIVIPENPTKKDYITIIIYYKYLVQEWEAWSITVKKIILTGSEK